MFSCRELLAAALLLAAGLAAAQTPAYTGIGRTATAKEIKAWDIDVRPDFKGLPKGTGTVAQGQVVWEAKCASCHGVFGESNEVFPPLIGGTTKDDIRTGRVARLTDDAFPGRSTLMKLATLSTLWDYISRAMPWTAPKTLKPDEVYAVTAFMLNLSGVVPDDFTLSDKNMAEVQQRLPNRNGMSLDHGLWPGRSMGKTGKADVRAVACMSQCVTEPSVASFIPDHARNAHGNLYDQNRGVGAQLGADTTKPEGEAAAARSAAVPAVAATAAAPAAARPAAPSPAATPNPALALAGQNNCLACHGVDNKIVGPSLRDIAKKYAGRADAQAYLLQKIQSGSTGVWGGIPMPAQSLTSQDAKLIAQWLADGAKK